MSQGTGILFAFLARLSLRVFSSLICGSQLLLVLSLAVSDYFKRFLPILLVHSLKPIQEFQFSMALISSTKLMGLLSAG